MHAGALLQRWVLVDVIFCYAIEVVVRLEGWSR
jgi:hypothetical protein